MTKNPRPNKRGLAPLAVNPSIIKGTKEEQKKTQLEPVKEEPKKIIERQNTDEGLDTEDKNVK